MKEGKIHKTKRVWERKLKDTTQVLLLKSLNTVNYKTAMPG